MTYIHKKAFTRRFVLTVEESRKFPTFVKNKATVNAPLGVIYPLFAVMARRLPDMLTSAWGFRVARSDEHGIARAFQRWSGRQVRDFTFFLCV